MQCSPNSTGWSTALLIQRLEVIISLSGPFLLLLWFCFWRSSVSAETNELDNIVACAGVIVDNGAIHFSIGNEAPEITYSAYLSEVFAGKAV